MELKPSKTRITHTLQAYQGSVGFDFLGWTVRQFPVGKTHSGKAMGTVHQLGFKTIITPSKAAIKRHTAEVGEVIKEKPAMPRKDKLIKEVNAKIHGWTNYHRTVAAAKAFRTCRHILFLQLHQWAKSRHPNKSGTWISNKYWHVDQGQGWTLHRSAIKAVGPYPHAYPTTRQSERNGKPLRRQPAVLESTAQVTIHAEWNLGHAPAKTTGKMQVVWTALHRSG